MKDAQNIEDGAGRCTVCGLWVETSVREAIVMASGRTREIRVCVTCRCGPSGFCFGCREMEVEASSVLCEDCVADL